MHTVKPEQTHNSRLKRTLARYPTRVDTDKNTVQTAQVTAEDDLLSINDAFPSTPNAQIDLQQISAWNQHSKYFPFRVRSPMKQASPQPIQHAKQSIPSQLSERSDRKSELKAKLKDYEVNRSFTLNGETSANNDTCILLTSDNPWRELDTINLDQLQVSPAKKQPCYRRKTMILHPFYSKSSKSKKQSEKNKQGNLPTRQESSRSKSPSKRASSSINTKAHTTELRFPLISQEAKLQSRLSFYRKQISLSK